MAAMNLSALGTMNQNREPAPEAIPLDSRFRMKDRLGAWKVRWAIGRSKYRVNPGLYALNKPGPDSPVVVTSNYKLTFDLVRRDLGSLKVWILVLDTKGVNVWCAAGKGTFGTKELVERLASSGLAQTVSHRTLILPQLGATGVSAPAVKTMSGWKVVWGPVYSRDLPAFIQAGFKAEPSMREIRFPLADRLVLTPVELVQGLKYLPFLILGAAALSLPAPEGWLERFLAASIVLASALPIGAVLFPILLPWLPGKPFGIKGLVLGGVSAGGMAWAAHGLLPGGTSLAGMLLVLVPPALGHVCGVVWLGMNFTGSSTYTSQTGAMTEVRIALPWIFGSLGLAALGLIAGIVLRAGGIK